ncbi:UPF0554 protein C2orf43-like protein [Verticillium dahliae VDG2]|nr:UPF0554 protein C2orf43-like protein [Verticillium dahliae VDG2]
MADMSTATPGGAAGPAQASASPSETSTRSSAPASKLRSCVVCRSRKLAARPAAPQASEPAAGAVMDRLRTLEKMVQDLGAELEQANAAKSGDRLDGAGVDSQRRIPSVAPGAGVQPGMGRMVGQEKGRSQYVGSSFWTRVSDELDALKADTQGLAGGDSDDSEDDTDSPGQTASTRESERGASERNGLLFGHNLGPSAPDLGQFRPLPSQIPFLVDVFSENVNFCIQIVHMPVLRDMIREMRGKSSGGIPPANEALAFAVYYAAVTSMSEEDVASSFGATKAELNYKFRLGLEHALAHADFIRLPTVTLIQAFVIFLALARRHDSPRYVWMMTGLATRMAVAVGLHRDGTHFAHLSPYEVEMRRRVWWCLCLLDIRAAEDQGTDLVPVPVSPGPFKGGDGLELFARHWRDLVSGPLQGGHGDLASIKRDDAGAMQFASPARHDSEYGVTPFSEWFPSDEYTQPHEIAGASHDQLDEMGLPVDWSRSGSLGLDLTPGSWDMADFDQLGGADMDMNGEASMNWGQWLESATLMEMDNL